MKIRYDRRHPGIWIFSDTLHRLTGTIRTRWVLWAFWLGYWVAVGVVGWWIVEGLMGWL